MLFFYTTLLMISFAMTPQETHKYTNHLINETSPYLLQHAHNPVDWYPWGEESLKKAKDEHKLILISIGYSACHWCHVMEHESFEDEEIAKVMNAHFVCIKVDKEERPDVDQVYMNAVHLMQGQGGWPLNCFALPDGSPVYGGTYFPPQKWLQTLKSLHLSYKENHHKFENYAQTLLNGIKQSDIIKVKSEAVLFEEEKIHEVFENLSHSFDMKEGGFGKAPKFPLPIGLEFCMAYGYVYNHKKANDFLFLTLDKMAHGGIYDQIGGGFSRYSVDDIWKAPHFEKMLYDNAQLVSLYAKAYKINKSPLYKNIVAQSLSFIKREMTQAEGGFYSALDADSEGVEGKYYLWTKAEIDALLKDDASLFCDYYGVLEQGNWEDGQNILMRNHQYHHWAKKYQLSDKDLEDLIRNFNNKLFLERQKRISPGLDDKIITAWNALMLKGYIDAYTAIGDAEYLEIAEKNADFLWFKLSDTEGKLFRTYKDGTAKINGFLDDYASTIDAFLALYQITFKEEYLERASLLLDYCQKNFLHTDSQMYYYTQKEAQLLVARKMEISDNVIPASNSIMAN
ncbi:MAG: thioredoxin domain-containing protein, partial [Bacteroidales bacterium]|nr:thioredoxin domain-containing protein [Bacteroidales bacterium]